jgi:hypothetical protein
MKKMYPPSSIINCYISPRANATAYLRHITRNTNIVQEGYPILFEELENGLLRVNLDGYAIIPFESLTFAQRVKMKLVKWYQIWK